MQLEEARFAISHDRSRALLLSLTSSTCACHDCGRDVEPHVITRAPVNWYRRISIVINVNGHLTRALGINTPCQPLRMLCLLGCVRLSSKF